MKKRIIDYRERIDRLLDEAPQETDWKGVIEEHLTQIAFFQHERLVHLIVTITFAILTLLCCCRIFYRYWDLPCCF